ncbi:MAG: hypothetical protein LBM76_01725 [Mycoplasmataceae bacterium]|jgi:hypothetical protein|nr:hypothetical protein [Mycoplasmataceae bacterium]
MEKHAKRVRKMYRASDANKKLLTTFRITAGTLYALKLVATKHKKTETDIVEALIYECAKKDGIINSDGIVDKNLISELHEKHSVK